MGEQGYRYFPTHKYIGRMPASFFPALAAFIDFLYVLTYFQLCRLKYHFCTDRLFPYFYERTFTYGTLLFGVYDTSSTSTGSAAIISARTPGCRAFLLCSVMTISS